MFSDIKKNKLMFEGAYRKLKCNYYYNKNFIVMREKISQFEDDFKAMDTTFDTLALHLSKIKTNSAKDYFQELNEKISFYAIPKKFESQDTLSKDRLISNTVPRDKILKTVNFFIDIPIELHIIDTLWTLFISKIAYDEKLITQDIYGNTILESVVSDYNSEDGINYQNNRLFNIYFYQYTKWRNKAFDVLEENHNDGKDSVLISLDLQGYYYSVKFEFSKLKEFCKNSTIFSEISSLTSIVEKMFFKYKEVIIPYRKDIVAHSQKQYPLPIGLFSSMVLANIYLLDFDKKVRERNEISYYGRYVDDLLFVYKKSINTNDKNEDVIFNTLINDGLLTSNDSNYCINGFSSLKIQKSKIKIVYLDHTESKALIDIYNNTIRIIPSLMEPIPDFDLKITSFDQNAYSIENFSKENKLRDIGQLNVDAYKVSFFFSSLIQKFSHINSFDNKINNIQKDIINNIKQIESFFTGSQCIEYYSNWLNYMCFLVIVQRYKDLDKFYLKVKSHISMLNYKSLDTNTFSKPSSINKKTKDYLLQHLEICRFTALALDVEIVHKHCPAQKQKIKKFINANMFNHSLIALSLSNYLKYNQDVSFLKMELKDIGEYSKIEDSLKFKWSPRFVHYDELLLLLFYYNHKKNQMQSDSNYIKEEIIKKFVAVNHLNYLENLPFEIDYQKEADIKYPNEKNIEYILRQINVPLDIQFNPDKVNVAVANIKLEFDTVKPKTNKWGNLTLKYKSTINDILRETYNYCKEDVKILVLPELSLPIYWINDIIRFSKRTQTAVIAGLQYISDNNGRVYNYILTILPFETGKLRYKNAFVYIREKNDYSPIEKTELAKIKMYCVDRSIAEYQIFTWKGITLSAFVCYELTDILARALLKGKCDIIAAPVFNSDTTYFSNIIDTTVRDLHSFVIQSNTSIYGDSRITGPYDRDSKDIFKIKGGDNDNVIIGNIEFGKYINYQSKYYGNLKEKIENEFVNSRGQKNKKKSNENKREKPNIKPLSARYTNHRTKRGKQEN